MIRQLSAAALLLLSASMARAAQPAESIGNAAGIFVARNAAEASYRKELEQLAQWCDQRQLDDAGRWLRGWLPDRDPYKSYIFKLPDGFAPPQAFGDDANSKAAWERFVEVRQLQADALLALAEQAHAASEYAVAFDLVRQACRENPQHAQARTILGFVRYNGGWAMPDTARRLSAGQVDHARFGWLAAGDVKRYEQGLRYYRGKWISAEEDERLHGSIRSGWRIDSEHYAITTNHSLEEGVRLSRRLEMLYDVWRHVFVDYYTPDITMQRWFAGDAGGGGSSKRPAVAAPRRQHQVSYFRNREEYNNALRPLQPQIDITLGIYFWQPRTAYFFAGEDQYGGTLLHEAAHQLFQETRQTGRDVGAKNNFALVEAVACYMESLVEHEHWYTLGGLDEGRVPAARKRLLEDQFYVPFREIAAPGMRELQRDERLPKIYSQISGQALFLMHADGARYRRPLVEALRAIYTSKADAGTLARLTGRSYEQLDEEYRRYLQAMNDER